MASHLLAINDDLLEEDDDVPDPMDEETALEIVRREYVSGTCGAFAVALHDATGWPVVGINGGMHVAVRSPDGRILDYMGLQTTEAVLRRYGMSSAAIEEWTREEAVDHVRPWDEDDHPWTDLRIARWTMLRGGAWTPHVDAEKIAEMRSAI